MMKLKLKRWPARDSHKILKTIRTFKSDMEKLLTPDLQVVWKAVEWLESGDWSLETAEKDLEEYTEKIS